MKDLAQENNELRHNLSIEFCENLLYRLAPEQEKKIKLLTLVAIKNLIKETKIKDSILYGPLIDTICDSDSDIRKMVIKIINEVMCSEIKDLLELKLKNENLDSEIKKDILNTLQSIK